MPVACYIRHIGSNLLPLAWCGSLERSGQLKSRLRHLTSAQNEESVRLNEWGRDTGGRNKNRDYQTFINTDTGQKHQDSNKRPSQFAYGTSRSGEKLDSQPPATRTWESREHWLHPGINRI
ncbi:hypothetical protein AVEN_266801-1 [Araneus ventricosus]|uniref:Uncharacterized protein n=1 Tax=Araneus ventricosus TaxID=182803 RepID=A0A4Y2HCZ4_ARAVE|nr:hypothetical protein AVEN_266801-1 [Araneus ventricosus]